MRGVRWRVSDVPEKPKWGPYSDPVTVYEDGPWPVLCPACGGDGRCMTWDDPNDFASMRQKCPGVVKPDGRCVCAACDGRGTVIQ